MPKVDRAALFKKESQNARKRFVAEQQKAAKEHAKVSKEEQRLQEERLAQERAKARQAGTSKFQRAMKAGAGNSTFAKAVGEVEEEEDEEEEDEEEYEYEYEVPEQPVSRGNETQPKKETAASRKKQQQDRNRDEMQLLLEEEKAARRQRIMWRLLRLLLVGFAIEAYREKPQQAAPKEGKPRKKGGKNNSDDEGWSIASLKEKANIFTGPVMMLIFTCFLGFLVIAGEDFDPEAVVSSEVNLYEVLGISSDADVLGVRKAYKNLALSWHPDKNPGCEACVQRFAKIGEAYEVLNNPEKRKAYDQRRAPDGSLDSVDSVELTAEDFEARVLRSNDVWFVEVYDPSEGMCKSFHPIWEDTAQKNQQLARFGRIDMSKHRRALRFLPQRIALTPVVFRLARGHTPELFQPRWDAEERGSGQLMRFVQDMYPQIRVLDSADSLKSFWQSPRPRILLSGPVASATRGRSRDFMQVQRTAHMWDEFFSIGLADPKLVEQTLGQQLVAKGKASGKGRTGAAWSIAFQGGLGGGSARVETKGVSSLDKLARELQDLITRAIMDQAPHITMRNHQQLCGAQGTRTFCLFLVDNPEGARFSSAMEELNASRSSFAQEVLELKSADEEATEEQFHIQPVRVMTSSSRLPWLPVAAGSAFRSVWAEADQASAFVLELETRRIAAVRTQSLREIYQQIAYDDLKFKDLPEHAQLVRSLPDPEVTLQRELMHGLGTAPGALAAFLLVAAAIAIAPELSLTTTLAIAAAIVSVAFGSWPMATRRFILFFWCTASPSAFECLVG